MPPLAVHAAAPIFFSCCSYLTYPFCQQETRAFFASTIGRVVTPWREVSWADFLLADFLTSLAKPISDGERALCHMLTGPVMDPSPRVHLAFSISHEFHY